MDNLRRSKIGIKYTPGIQFLSHGIADNMIGITREDYLCQRTLQITLRTDIEEVAKKIAVISESSEGDERINPIIEEYVISVNLFDFLLEEERLPETINNKKIVYEHVNYRLLVRVILSACHEYTAACFNKTFLCGLRAVGLQGIECFADAEGYYSSRGLLLTLNVVADAGNFCSLPFADVNFIAYVGGYC